MDYPLAPNTCCVPPADDLDTRLQSALVFGANSLRVAS